MTSWTLQYGTEIVDGPSYKVYSRHLTDNFTGLKSDIDDRLSLITSSGQTVTGAITWNAAQTYNAASTFNNTASFTSKINLGVASDPGSLSNGDVWYNTTTKSLNLQHDGGTVVITPPGIIIPFAGFTAPNGYLICNGQAVSRSTYAALFSTVSKTSTFTVTIATPGVVTWTSHGLKANDPVSFTTTGALPTGLIAGTVYYIVGASITTNTFQVSATIGGAAINTTGSQSGVHTALYAPFGRGDGSTTFNVPDLRGRALVGTDNMGGTAASIITSASSNGVNASNLGGVFGAETHTLTNAQLPTMWTGNAVAVTAGGAGLTTGAGTGYTTGSSAIALTNGSGQAHSNTQPSMGINYIIKV